MSMKLREVLIFKAQIDDDDNDFSYSKTIEAAGYTSHTIPVLDFEYCNLELLKECLSRPTDYSGIIITSPRAVKALVKSLGSARNLLPEWRERSMFVVGESSKRILNDELDLIGQCGITENAVGLADLIKQKTYDQPLLFPCSNIRRNTLPELLSEKNIPYKEINVYCTQQNAHLEKILFKITNGGKKFPEYMVFFSPSGVKYSVPILLELRIPLGEIKIVAIGNTTSSALKENNVVVWGCSSKPSPQYLLKAILGEVKTEGDVH